MRLSVAQSVRDSFPELRIGVVWATGVDNTGTPPALGAELEAASAAFRAKVPDDEALGALPLIDAWRRAYRAFGVNPKRQRPSAEAYLRRVIKGGPLSRISAVVDVYILSELLYLLPVGGYDLSAVQGDLELRHSPGGESFVGIGAEKADLTDAGEVVYSDGGGVVTRAWNSRDADRTKITEATKDLVLCVELPYAVDAEAVEKQIAFIAEGLKRHCAAASVAAKVVSGAELASFSLSP